MNKEFSFAFHLPFVKAIGENQASSVEKGVFEAGFSATVSALALNRFAPMDGSLAQEGINPHMVKFTIMF